MDGGAVILMDGGTGTELIRRGVKLDSPAWSALAIESAAQTLREIHRDYLDAGAQVLIANTFRTHGRSLAKVGREQDAAMLTRQAVQTARAACAEAQSSAEVWGSVAPLEDCYSPQLSPDAATCRAEHEAMIRHLLDAGVDLILLETMITERETAAAMEAAQRLSPGKWAVSFCTKSEGPPGILLSGEPLIDLKPLLVHARAVGVNCMSAPSAPAQVHLLRAVLPAEVPILVKPNVSWCDETGRWNDTDAESPHRFAEYAMQCVDEGAVYIGGCCGTTPATIATVAKRLGQR